MLTTESWLKCYKPLPDAQLRLFCFPYVGSSAVAFRSWSDLLPSTIEVHAIELPGRGTRIKESVYTKMQPLIEAIAPALLPKLDKPFAFFGHSMGAILAFECSRFLRKNYGLLPSCLFVSGRNAPHVQNQDSLANNVSKEAFLEELRLFKGTPEKVLKNPAMLKLLLPILQADYEVIKTYEYTEEVSLKCALITFGSSEDIKTTIEGLKAWKEHTTDYFYLHKMPGNHFFINSSKSLLIEQIVSYLSVLGTKESKC